MKMALWRRDHADVTRAIDEEARVKAVDAAERAKLLPDESKEVKQ